MRSNNQQENQTLTPMQKQAVLVCIVCALAALLTIGITLTMLKRGKNPTEQPGDSSIITPAPAPEGEEDISDHYQINETSSALLTGTADAGDAYQEQTLFIGDSNTVRLYANGLISLQQFCAKEGIGTSAALNEGIVTFKRDDNRYTIAQAVAKMKPRRVVIMLGTNDNGMSTEDFISHYTALVQAIQASYPYTDIIVNTVPPVPSNHSNYPNMDQTRIDDFNMALLTMCEQLGVKFLNSAEALKDANGYGNVDYYQSGDIHLKPAGLKVLLKYLRTHAYQTDDRRPDTANIPTRAEYTANPSSAVGAPSSSETVSSSVVEEKTEYQADYRVDKTGGGSLTCGDESGKSLTVKVTSAAQSVTVTAVPEDGYVFVKWTKRTRTDTNFDQNVDVTAVFAAASIQVSSSGKAGLGDSYTFKATLKGKYLDASSIRWYVNGTEVTQAAGKTTVKGEVDPSMVGGTFRVYATASYNDCTVTSNKLELTVSGGTSGSTSSSSSSSASSKEDKPASSKEETSSSKEDKPASSKEEKPASSSSNGTSESAGSSSKVEKPASSSQSSTSSKGETSSSSKQEHAASSKEEKPASSKQEQATSSKEEKPASSKEEKPASSKTEASASKEAAN
jgi:lysophospholipase L1-like esterase